MGLPYLAAIRFLAGEYAECLGLEIAKACDAVEVKAGTERFFSVVVASTYKKIQMEKTILPLLPTIESSIAAKTLSYVVLENDQGETKENWRFIPRYQKPFWLEMEFDSLTSNSRKDKEICPRLCRLVDQGSMDVAVCSNGYYGFAPLVFLFYRVNQIGRGIEMSGDVQAIHEELMLRLSIAFGHIHDMRKLEPQFVPANHISAWSREWRRRIAVQ